MKAGDALALSRIPGVWMRGHDGRASLPFSPWYLHVPKTCRAASPIRPGQGSQSGRGHGQDAYSIRCGWWEDGETSASAEVRGADSQWCQ